MDYRKLGEAYYLRMDRGDEIVACILDVCRRENIASATYTGIGGCQSAQLQTFIPEKGEFETEEIIGLLELVSFTGNVISDDEGRRHSHTHALFAFVKDGRPQVRGGHLKATTVLYTAEIELRPVYGGRIGYALNSETGTGFWDFEE